MDERLKVKCLQEILISAISEVIVRQLCCNHLTLLCPGSGTQSRLLEDVVVGQTVLINVIIKR